MGNLPSKFYLVQWRNGDVVGVFSNKKIMFERLCAVPHLKPYSVYSYQSFSELIKWNSRCMFSTSTEPIVVSSVAPNAVRS